MRHRHLTRWPTVKPSASSSAERSAMPVKVADADLKRPIELFA
jgi:hypothetical protein